MKRLLSPKHLSKLTIPLIKIRSTEVSQSSNVKITHKYTLGTIDKPTFCVRFDYNDKYIAAAMSDGSIAIYNVFTQKKSFELNTELEEKMPTTNIR